jgi:glucose-6-phosphate 1-epimerase
MELKELNSKFSISNCVVFSKGKGGFTYAELTSKNAKAQISLYGAHVLHFVPNGEKDVLWNTEKSYFEEGKPIRGGIPICWPWFGPHANDPNKPAHGFARLSNWEISKTAVTPSGETEISLTLTDSDVSRSLWPHSFRVSITIRLGNKLTVELSVTNTGKEVFEFTDALHSYLLVKEVSQISVEGLEGCSYFDGTNNNSSSIQSGRLIEIKKEENRRYLGTKNNCIVYDPMLKRKILIEKSNSNTTVVWNPWIETAKSMADMGDLDYKTMICVEAANAYNEIITLKPEQSFKMSTTLSISPF